MSILLAVIVIVVSKKCKVRNDSRHPVSNTPPDNNQLSRPVVFPQPSVVPVSSHVQTEKHSERTCQNSLPATSQPVNPQVVAGNLYTETFCWKDWRDKALQRTLDPQVQNQASPRISQLYVSPRGRREVGERILSRAAATDDLAYAVSVIYDEASINPKTEASCSYDDDGYLPMMPSKR